MTNSAPVFVLVRNFKDDPDGTQTTLHGAASRDEAEAFIRAVTFDSPGADFLTASIVEPLPATVEAALAPYFPQS